jgi:hypothetical protein
LKVLWHIALLFVATFAVLGGIYLGFGSCGGVAWHRPVIIGTLAVATIGTCLLPYSARHPILVRAGILFGVPFAFLVAQSAGAQFYPTNPASFSAFVAGVWREFLAVAC